jgi:NAD(P)-dependent dehydrogenase (short-subunit alcohol dehydrogenase family)
MARRCENKVAIITGGGSGIGRATALVLAEEGASIVVADISQEGGQETVRLVEEKDGKAIFVPTDVTRPDQLSGMVESALSQFGGIDILFANAGVPGVDKPLVDWDDVEWEQVISVNLTGTFNTCRAVIPAMIERGGGAIVATSSDAGIANAPFTCGYNASKAGVISLVKTLAAECAPYGIRVNAVSPGEVDTPMGLKALFPDNPEIVDIYKKIIPMNRIGTPEEMAQAVLFLVSEAASYVTGIVLPVDGGILLRNEAIWLMGEMFQDDEEK